MLVRLTFFRSHGSSQLDLFITNRPEKVLRFGEVSVPNFSHHDMICGSIDFDKEMRIEYISFRDYKHADGNLIMNEFNKFDWDGFYSIGDSDLLTNLFNHRIKYLFDYCIPMKTYKKNQPQRAAWLTFEILRAMVDRDHAYAQWKQTPGHNDHSFF